MDHVIVLLNGWLLRPLYHHHVPHTFGNYSQRILINVAPAVTPTAPLIMFQDVFSHNFHTSVLFFR